MDSMHDKQGRANARAVHHVMGRIVPISLLDTLGADAAALSATIAHIMQRVNVNHSGAKALVAHAVAQEHEEQAGGFSFDDFLSGAEKVLNVSGRAGRIASATAAQALGAAHRLRGAGFSFSDFLKGAKKVATHAARGAQAAASAAQQYAPIASKAASSLGYGRVSDLADRASQIASYAPSFAGAGGLYIGGEGGYIVPNERQYRVGGAGGMSLGGLALGGARYKKSRARRAF
jgi:hypothetical protein